MTQECIRGLVRHHGWIRMYPGILEITVRKNAEGLGAGVIVHKARPLQAGIMMLGPRVPVMNPLFTFLVLGSVAEQGLVATALDAAVSQREVSVRGLCDVLKNHGHRYRGAAVLGAILVERGYYVVPPNNKMEAAFVALLVAAGLPEPQRQVGISGPEGWIGRVDFAYLEFRLIIELDGFGTHGTRDAFQSDRERDRKLVAAGWRIVRFTWVDIQERPERVAVELRLLLAQAKAQTAGTR